MSWQDEVERIVEQGLHAFPALSARAPDIRERLQANALDLEPAFQSRHAAELFLAYACAEGDSRAIELFELTVLSNVRKTLQRVLGSGQEPDDVLQQLRISFLALDGKERWIARYRGAGPLLKYARRIAVRMAMELRKPQDVVSDSLEEMPAVTEGVEMRYLRTKYRQDFKQAFRTALEQLDARQRSVMQLHFFHNASMESIGALYQVHKSTVSRWLADARWSLRELLRAEMTRRLSLKAGELDSLLSAMGSSSLSVSFGPLAPSNGEG